MTSDSIIEQVWELTWYEAAKVAVYSNYIVAHKIWWVYLVLIVGYMGFLYWEYRRRGRK